KRGSFAALTSEGWTAIETAAPDHVDSVREHLVDVLGPKDFASLGNACTTIAENLQASERE
ncbi:MAG: MarR family transcriptional regulator, partial [Actinobacteria bacterium]|nr:MarR family transcriptional regulator [Actinomycetota bacterium]